MYLSEEKLNLTDRVYVTPEVKKVIEAEKKRLRKNNIRMSAAKIVCNLILEKYDHN
jgi:hypothetical protein